MKRSTTIGFLALLGIAATMVIVGNILQRQPEFPANISNDSEIESITAEVFKSEGMGIRAIPPTVIPAEYRPKIMNVLRAAVRNEYPHQWDDSQTIGKLTIKRHDGKLIQMTFPSAGHNPLCFTADGVRYMRGGKYKPIWNNPKGGYGDESLMLVGVIQEIYGEQVRGKKSDFLVEILNDFERSAGNRPPR